MSKLSRFSGLYPVSKTLRFELRPMGATLDFIQKSGMLIQDDHLAKSYGEVKKIIDRYHKYFIDQSLSQIKSHGGAFLDSVRKYSELYQNPSRTVEQNKELDDLCAILRNEISSAFTGGKGTSENESQAAMFDSLFGKELIENVLPSFVQTEEERNLLAEFKGFTSYFVGFHTNRKNMYTDAPLSSSIAYRLIHENLPKFIDNIRIFEKIRVPLKDEIQELIEDLSRCNSVNVDSVDNIFSIGYYVHVLSQSSIELYNSIIGKIVTTDGYEIKGLNERINQYNQKKSRDEKLPLLKPLYKQILSDREQLSWLPEAFDSSDDLLDAVRNFYDYISDDLLDRTHLLMQTMNQYDLDQIYLTNDAQLTEISRYISGDWNTLNLARVRAYDSAYSPKKRSKSYEEKRDKALKEEKNLSIAKLNQYLTCSDNTAQVRIEQYFEDHCSKAIAETKNAYDKVRTLLSTPYPKDKNLIQDKEQTLLIKELLDGISRLQRYLKPIAVKAVSDKDDRFYGEFYYIYDALQQVIPLYNMVRNYLTRKPYSHEKIKLNFGNESLLNGWDRNKETDNTCVILRKDGLYYLGIMNKKHNKVFNKKELPGDGKCYQKMDYKLLPGPNKMLPKVFLSQKGIDRFHPDDTLLANYKSGTHKKGSNFNLSDLHHLIDFFKQSIQKHEDWSQFGFEFSSTSSYPDISAFYREVEKQGYKITFREVSEQYINTLVDEGKLYLFQIYNKDFSPYSKGVPNLHTMYWKMLFDERNLADVVYKLNGQAEIFYRKKSLDSDKPTHPAYLPIAKKNTVNEGEKSIFEYDLIKDKRYTVDKFQFHVPITMNFKGGNGDKVNDIVNDFIRENYDDLYVIGIDRGERHLLYVSVIDAEGRIIEQYSLNEIINQHNNHQYRTDYHGLLERRENDRQKERQNWSTIEGIKDLKKGYLSQVIHRISQLMMKYNAIVAIEDLNMGFKNMRQRFERSVYQQFEKQLIDKLNYLVRKSAEPTDAGGLLRAYQLTEPFTSFQKMGKQNGFLFYIPAWNTSKIDPVTGFVNLFDTRYENVEKAQDFFSSFEDIRYNSDKEWFEFSADYKKFTTKADGSRTGWILCTYGSRIKSFRNPDKNNQWDYKTLDLTQAFIDLFERYGIAYLKGNLQHEITIQTSKDFFVELLGLFRLIVQMRNSCKETGEDYLISPVADDSGYFYDSRKCGEHLPSNADANGAYNIALKGLWVLRQIQQTPKGTKKIKLSITNKEWLTFVQDKPYRKN